MLAWMFVEHPVAFGVAMVLFCGSCSVLVEFVCWKLSSIYGCGNVSCTGFLRTKQLKSLAESRSTSLLNKHIVQNKDHSMIN
jgi:hypothetical protein